MTDLNGIEVLTDEVLRDLYDPGSFARGRAYATEGRVTMLKNEPGSLASVVEGSGRSSYLVRVDWQKRGTSVGVGDNCSCPLGGDCKHAVATILTARVEQVAAIQSGHRAPARETRWRQVLDGIVDDDSLAQAHVPLALQFAVKHPLPTTYDPDPVPQVTIRPLRMGKRDRWIKTGVSWRELGGYLSYSTRELDPDHVTVLRTMLAATRSGSYYSDTGPLSLAMFDHDLWFHLARAIEAGIALVDDDGHEGAVEVSDAPAEAVVDLTADDNGDVTMATGLAVDGEALALDPDHAGTIGSPPHGLFIETPDDGLLLVPLTEPMTPGLARLLEAPPLVVPAADVDELVDAYHPHLARRAAVGSSDGSVTVTTSAFEGLTLFVRRHAVDVASLEWTARYRRGDRVSHRALRGVDGTARDWRAEREAIAALELPTGVLPELVSAGGDLRDLTVRGADAVTLLTELVPVLRARGEVEVEVTTPPDDDVPDLREAIEDPLISLNVTDAGDDPDRTDWFDLAVEVSVDGEEIPFATLFAALTDDQEVLVLPSGTWLRLDRPELTRLKQLIDEARGLADADGDGEARVNRYQVAWWDELAALGVVKSQSERWAASLARMRDLAAPEPVDLPGGLQAKLRPYQQEGLDWLAFLHRNGLGGILADDMGLGKTVQTLALCLHIHEQQPDARFLVVAPTSVVENWHREAERFAPGLNVRTINETATRRGTTLADEIAGADLVVTSYALFRLEFDEYAAHPWELLLLDEAQFVKNHQGKTHQCARKLDAATKIAITGTPLENSLMDLWSLLSITAPGLYPDPNRFSRVYRKPIERGEAPELLATLRRRIAPLMRRRTKEAVLTELPPKTEQTVEIELNPRHARIYQTQLQRQRQKVLGLVGDVQRHRFEIFKSLTLLRQLSLDPALVDDAHESVGSAKLDRLVDDLTEVLAEGHRALVFSQFTRYLARVRTRLDAAGIDYAYLDGRTRKRAEAISSFKDGDAPVFVISLKAGGVGLNLTEADYCFVLDPWWNPAVETQAVDRTHRIGQVNPVMVYRYVSTGTIEEKVMELKARKAALFADVLDAEGALAGALTESDIRGLLDLD